VFSFTVIILTYGREELLTKCLDSLRPTDVSWELILVANGKVLPPEILEQAKGINSHLQVIENQRTLPPGKARNQALELAQGEWIFFLDDDAYILPGYWDIAKAHLLETASDVFGGPDSPAKGMNTTGEALALALASPLCTGKTSSRHRSFGKRPIEATEDNLTSCNLWVKKASIGAVRFPDTFF
jgi:glycosyltransferase involved in cell wall biosynthesis